LYAEIQGYEHGKASHADSKLPLKGGKQKGAQVVYDRLAYITQITGGKGMAVAHVVLPLLSKK
jgi:hypothetical protein